MKVLYNDGGRSKYFPGTAGDCVVRAIAITSGLDYKKVYDDLHGLTMNSRCRTVKKKSPRNGVSKKVYHDYILNLGFKWIPVMKIGTGCTMHLKDREVPNGTLIVRCGKHLTSVIDGIIYDTYDPSRDGKRAVYGYYIKEK